MRFKTWVEMFSTQRWHEDVHEVSDQLWAEMTEEEREAYMQDAFENVRNEVCNGGYEVIES